MKRLLNEVYRPQSPDDFVFPSKDVEYKVRKWVKNKDIPNILFSGPAGCGKSSLTKILIKELDIDPGDVKFVNCSLVKAIDFCRDELAPWLGKRPLGDIKVVYLEELNRFSNDGMKALNDLTESYSSSVRFIATTNYPKIITPELISRFQQIHIDEMDYESLINFIVDIIEKEEITIEEDSDILSHIDEYQPDIRKIINSIDEHTDSDNKLYPLDQSNSSADLSEWENIWQNEDPYEKFNRLLDLTEFVDNINYEWFYTVMYMNSNKFKDQGNAIILISEYLKRAKEDANQRIHLDAFLYNALVYGDG